MNLQRTRRILSVFLASPGDVVLERDTAAEVVNRFNKLMGPKFGWQIDRHRWEDTKPGYGRPQSIINSAVDNCDLFIGLLWERWGQPTGSYSSGFHEEFERAKTRRESTGDPEIWLVFKAPRSDKMGDPGDELRKVLEFRNEQISLRQVLFREISSSDEWERCLFDWLIEHVWEHGQSIIETDQRQAAETQPAVQAFESSRSNVPVGEQAVPKVSEQLVELSSKVSRVVSSNNLEFSHADANLLGEFEVARLYLLSETWMALRYTSDFLGTHETNLLYKNRHRLDITVNEEFQILRTLLHDSSGVVPGWFWFSDAFPDGPESTLLSIANDDSNTSLRVSALKLLTSAQIHIPPNLWASMPLSDESERVSAEAIKYLGFAGDESALPLIEAAALGNARPQVAAAASEAKYSILVRVDPTRAFVELISNGQYPSAETIRAFGGIVGELTTENLAKGSEAPSAEIRKLSITELARRGELPLELAERLREDPSTDIKQVALQVIVNQRGKSELDRLRQASKLDTSPFSLLAGHRKEIDVDSIALNYYRTLPPERLLEAVEWVSIDGPIAYKALAIDHFDIISGLLRSDLETDFERIREKYLDGVKARSDEETAQRLSRQLQQEKLDEFMRSLYAESGLSGLAPHAQSSDIGIARKYLGDNHQNTRLAAVKIVSLFGDDTDVQTLLDISDKAWGELENLAAISAIRLSAHPNLTAIEMARSDRRGRGEAALQWLFDQDSVEVRDYFRGLLKDESGDKRAQGIRYLSSRPSHVDYDSGELDGYFRELLNDEDQNNRVRGILFLVKRLSRMDLERLLDEYMGQPKYYYNVVTHLDRFLYAPSVLKDMFMRDIKQEGETA
jgi:hypothetical protein